MFQRARWILLAAVVMTAGLDVARGAGPVVEPGDLVAVAGDSITEQRLYSVYMEDYLLMCSPVANVRTMQFGWGGDTTWGFLGDKLQNDVLRFKPTVMTMNYGMNDGGYWKLLPEVAEHYRTATQGIIDAARKGGVRTIILGTPGVVDSDIFRNGDKERAAMYNETLGGLAAIDKELAQKNGLVFADVHGVMMDVMAKAKAKYGAKFGFAGEKDGIHPGASGHLVMAYAYLKAMGFDGNIGTITVDLKAGKAEATEGHKIVSEGVNGGDVDVESTRYPFCFFGKPGDSNGTASVEDMFGFNEDLNRFMLVVKNAGGEKVKVTWGNATKEFAAADLEKGINLAAEFLDNPFVGPFMKVQGAVRAQQDFELGFVKGFIFNIPSVKQFADEGDKAALERIAVNGGKKDLGMFAAAKAMVGPVRHAIKIEVEK